MRRFKNHTDQTVTCDHCNTKQSATVTVDRKANVAGFECGDCGQMSEA